MTISEPISVGDWLAGLSGDDLSARRAAAEQRLARSQQALARLNVDQRKIDTRRKIILGGAVIAAARRDSDFRARLRDVLDATVTVPRDRALLGLPPVPATTEVENG